MSLAEAPDASARAAAKSAGAILAGLKAYRIVIVDELQVADDARRLVRSVQRIPQRHLKERQLVLDHEDLVQAAREGAERVAVVGMEHPDLEQAHAGVGDSFPVREENGPARRRRGA